MAGSDEDPHKPARSGLPWRQIALAVLVVYLVLLIVVNSDRVKLNFVFFSTSTSLLIALILAAGLGFVAGMLTYRSRVRRGRGPS